ncbi:GerA spore germination protein [Thermaerobacter marianensis DSM 12885]|uniref:GerA spore germination protein n=1 Tax=Thermaerobacter marianensis (strain ATCC 700841 / DSM 12885 / JCM 10246 / 7p75a) TaxID=644966 RepID=E6SKP0_THEM7|nr:spore germination protein [Thermaerobacter marianensis]ADU51248.1 GerA spore germination protein [Thermaerobacter marianensis DSM 12885]
MRAPAGSSAPAPAGMAEATTEAVHHGEQKHRIRRELEANLQILRRVLGVGETFDVLVKPSRFAGRDAVLVGIDGLVKAEVLLRIMQALAVFKPDPSAEEDARLWFTQVFVEGMGFIEVDPAETLDQVVDKVLMGPVALLVDGLDHAFIIDVRTYPSRGIQEPALEKVLRGPHDGFTETLVSNTALIRRRLRDPQFRAEILHVGRRSKTDVALVYLKDVANPQLVRVVRDRLKQVDTDAIPMAESAVVEHLVGPRRWWNPFPLVRFTERPDVAAVHLIEGHVLVLVDTSPSAIILPTTLFHHLQHAEEFHENATVGTWARLIRYAGVLLSWVGPPLWVALVLDKERLSGLPAAWVRILGPRQPAGIGLEWQFILGEVGIELIRLALIHTPEALSTSLGIIGAVLIGQLAVQVGLFTNEAILYIALAALGTFATPSVELAQAFRLLRVGLLILAGALGIPGFLLGLLASFVLLLGTRSFGVPYLWPLVPFDGRVLARVLLRQPMTVRIARDRTFPRPLPEREEEAGGAQPA